jgi:hypothetical protein
MHPSCKQPGYDIHVSSNIHIGLWALRVIHLRGPYLIILDEIAHAIKVFDWRADVLKLVSTTLFSHCMHKRGLINALGNSDAAAGQPRDMYLRG